MASSSRSKQDKNAVSEVNSARNKLDGVLQTLMDKADDSTEPSDEDCSKFSPDIAVKELSANVSPSKRTLNAKTPRKRRRKDDTSGRENSNGNFSYVMKLFDRSVDLAKFNEDTPLYPICRAWMYNEPYNGNLKLKEPASSIEDSSPINIIGGDEQTESKDVYNLPTPLRNPKNERIPHQDSRIPVPLPRPPESLDIHADPALAPSKENLLMDNMTRWKAVRQRWKDAAILNESRYKESLSIIKSLKVIYE